MSKQFYHCTLKNKFFDTMLNIDYLQLSCQGYVSDLKGFRRERKPYGTRQFNYIDEYYLSDKLFCTVCSKPYSVIINSKLMLIKFSNEFLYYKDKFKLFDNFLQILNVREIKISRLDLAYDFNHFVEYNNPMDLIFDFLGRKIIKKGKAKYTIIGSRENKHTIDYLRFGTNTSDICAYLYNKTKEMSEVKNKPYIRESWRQNGLDLSIPIWRLEYSIKTSSFNIVNQTDGDNIQISYESIKDFEKLKYIYNSLTNKYFQFKRITKDTNITRQPTINLIDIKTTKGTVYTEHISSDATRADKVFIRKTESLITTNDTLTQSDKQQLKSILLSFIIGKDMLDFYEERIKGTLTEDIKQYRKLYNQNVNSVIDSIIGQKCLEIDYQQNNHQQQQITHYQQYMRQPLNHKLRTNE